jgi:hypothetical protein
MLLDRAKHWPGETFVWTGEARSFANDHGQLVGVRHRQRTQQKRVNQREDGCIRAQTESQRENGCEREAGCTKKLTAAEAQVTAQLIEEWKPSTHSIRFADLRESSEAAQGCCSGLLPRHAERHVLRCGQVDVSLQLFFEFRIKTLSPEERRDAA